jgi:hypothetical protein
VIGFDASMFRDFIGRAPDGVIRVEMPGVLRPAKIQTSDAVEILMPIRV